jgi:hypothetical protein
MNSMGRLALQVVAQRCNIWGSAASTRQQHRFQMTVAELSPVLALRQLHPAEELFTGVR